MSTMGNADADRPPDAEPGARAGAESSARVAVEPGAKADAQPGFWTSFATALRLIVGWSCVMIAALNLVVEADRPSGVSDAPFLIFNMVWLIGGLMLLALAWIDPGPRTAGYVSGGVLTVAGMVASAVPTTATTCCFTDFAIRHGYPFTFVARDDGVGAAAPWHFDVPHALVDLMFWAYLGLLALLAVSLLRSPPQSPDVAEAPQPQDRQYIEHRAAAPERAPQKTDGRVP